MWLLCFLQIDTNGKGTLDYGEFIAISLHLQRMANDEHLHKAFSYFYKDGNGYIDPIELRDALMKDGYIFQIFVQKIFSCFIFVDVYYQELTYM